MSFFLEVTMRSQKTSPSVPHRCGFTMIELLVVIAIIAILASLLGLGITHVHRRARHAKAKVQIKQLEKAFIAYHDEYGEWPVFGSEDESAPGVDCGDSASRLLRGEIVTGTGGDDLNPQEISYFAITDSMLRNDVDGTFGFIDPWKRCYRYMMDFDDDGVLEVSYGSSSSIIEIEGGGVAVWSQGRDGDDALVGDNVTSWKSQ
jgi:prepilin-type N-terminal cleavage/methylation domain-containing protein